MSEPQVSEEMKILAADFLASIVCYEHTQDKVAFDEMTRHVNALLSAIAALGARAEKAEVEREEAQKTLKEETRLRLHVMSEHCKDCCCARLWKIIGLTSRGFSIYENVERLIAERDKWERLARTAVKAGVFHPDTNEQARAMIEMEQAIDDLGPAWDEAVAVKGEE